MVDDDDSKIMDAMKQFQFMANITMTGMCTLYNIAARFDGVNGDVYTRGWGMAPEPKPVCHLQIHWTMNQCTHKRMIWSISTPQGIF